MPHGEGGGEGMQLSRSEGVYGGGWGKSPSGPPVGGGVEVCAPLVQQEQGSREH